MHNKDKIKKNALTIISFLKKAIYSETQII